METGKRIKTNGQPNDYVLRGIVEVAKAANVTISSETMGIYVGKLCHFSKRDLDAGVQQVIDDWNEASKMPPVPFIVQRCNAAAKYARMSVPALPEGRPDFDPAQRKRDVEEILRASNVRSFPGPQATHAPHLDRERERELFKAELRRVGPQVAPQTDAEAQERINVLDAQARALGVNRADPAEAPSHESTEGK